MIENKMKLKMISEGIAILQRNEQDLVCPIVPPVEIRQKIQNALGQVNEQISIQKSPCNTNCPLLFIDSKQEITLNCGGNPVKYKIEEWVEKQDNNLKILK